MLNPALLIFCASAGLAHAGTNGFMVPSFRGSAGSQTGYWETFSVAVGAPGNLPDGPDATTTARLTQSDTNAFLTGSGNIYNQSGVSAFTLTNTTPFAVGTVVLQTRTLGGELDYGSFALTYGNGSGDHSLAPLIRLELNRGSQPGLGATVSTLCQWDLSGLGVASYTLSFRAAGTSCSFDSLTLDVWDRFVPLFTPPFVMNDTAPAIERWMYANNASPCDRPAGSTFGTLDEQAGVDTRHAQVLVGWDTAALVPTNRGPASYLVRRARLTLTINRGELFAYDPTHDDYRTYLRTDQQGHLPDADAGRPVELFGVGYRNGYDAASFDQCALFGTNSPSQRNAFASGYSTNGALVDVSNNVGKTNEAVPPFEAVPFAVGQTTNVAPGQLVPASAKITFDLNLADPFVLGYLQAGLNAGRLRFMVSSLHTSGGPAGPASFPDFATRFNEAVADPTRLELEGVVVGSNDLDADGLPDDWELASLQTLSYTGSEDADGDGASNYAELRAGTDPLAQTSALRVTALERNSAGPVTLHFPHAAGRRYAIEVSEDFVGWRAIKNAAPIYLDPGTAQWTDDGSLTDGLSPARFYRVTLEQP